MLPTFQMDFDELPLAVINGFQCANIKGAADIQYAPEGGWQIVGIALDGFKNNHSGEGPRYHQRLVWLASDHPLYAMVSHTLASSWADKVQDEVDECNEADREAMPFNVADRRRELRLVHG